ncbi:MAG TPA: hypothetical protein VFT74_04150, partial [Isosphaeraceae bacterium]|nr:hypothetical protein [Isosphaeraceae bacterium]
PVWQGRAEAIGKHQQYLVPVYGAAPTPYAAPPVTYTSGTTYYSAPPAAYASAPVYAASSAYQAPPAGYPYYAAPAPTPTAYQAPPYGYSMAPVYMAPAVASSTAAAPPAENQQTEENSLATAAAAPAPPVGGYYYYPQYAAPRPVAAAPSARSSSSLKPRTRAELVRILVDFYTRGGSPRDEGRLGELRQQAEKEYLDAIGETSLGATGELSSAQRLDVDALVDEVLGVVQKQRYPDQPEDSGLSPRILPTAQPVYLYPQAPAAAPWGYPTYYPLVPVRLKKAHH